MVSALSKPTNLPRKNSMKNFLRSFFLVCIVMFPYSANAHCSILREFQLKEFEGDWILTSNSAGGVGVNTGPGISSGVLRQVTFDKNGIGTENYVTRMFYLANGTLFKAVGLNVESITLVLTDPIHGAGSIIIQDHASIGAPSIYNFIAKRNKKGKINKLFLILIEGAGNQIIVTGALERQFEE